MRTGKIERISGAVITATGISDAQMGEVVYVGEEGLLGEIVRVGQEGFTVQVYESTSGLGPDQQVLATGKRLTAELGPGLLTNILDGIGRPLQSIMQQEGPFLKRGSKINTLPRDKKWAFTPAVKKNAEVEEGDIIGQVDETRMILHKVMVPRGMKGKVVEIHEGKFAINEPVVTVSGNGQEFQIPLMQDWAVREPRHHGQRLSLEKPLITGQRVIDTFFPIPKGGAACIPGGFGTGKTVVLQQIARWSDADVIIYIGCGERGNEMADVLREFPRLTDPHTGLPLMERTILIANTSNMPVAAREACIYLGVTFAEYYRDMGYDVALMADSTSRWAEALREISGRLEEMPAEKGFPAYLPERMAEFYERAGRVVTLGSPQREGSVTIIGAVSPPGGDLNEPVTIHTLRYTGVFWALDTELAYSRHFPAIDWLKSHSLHSQQLSANWSSSLAEHSEELRRWWHEKTLASERLREEALNLLSESAQIESIARIIGESALPDQQRLTLLTAELIKEGFLRQSAYDKVDSFCEQYKQVLLLRMILRFHAGAQILISKQVPIEKLLDLPEISTMKRVKSDEAGEKAILQLGKDVEKQLEEVANSYDFSLSEGGVSEN